jgi:hypothetical protein
MSVWLWIFVGVAGFFAASLLVGLFVAAILAKLGQEFSGLIEFDPLELSPQTDPLGSRGSVAEERIAAGRSTSLRLK